LSSKTKFGVLLASSLVVIYAVVGGMMGRVSAQDGAYPQLSIFTEVIERIRNDYVDEPNLMRAMEGAIRGMVESVDPNGGYLSPESVDFFEGHDPLEDAGIGVILVRKFDYPVIVSAIPGGPAALEGLGTGDTIEGIGGESLREHNLVEVQQLLAGQPGTTVELNVIRRSAAATETVTLTRAVTAVPAVEARLLDEDARVGYLKVPLVAPGKAAEVRQQVERLTAEGAMSLVLDLRNSAGGTDDEAFELANLFVQSGTLGYIEGQTVERETFTASPGIAVSSLPLAVLINEGTADAAEIAAGAIRDNDRGPVVGLRTFGSAAVRRLLPLQDGWALLLSVANYYTPDGDEILTEGVQPTDEVAPAAVVLDPLAVVDPNNDATDRQLDRAIELLLLEETAGQAAA
jgi:carboxyl-terminal processing protease